MWGRIPKRENIDATYDQVEFEYQRNCLEVVLLIISTEITGKRIQGVANILEYSFLPKYAHIRFCPELCPLKRLSEGPNCHDDAKTAGGLSTTYRFLCCISAQLFNCRSSGRGPNYRTQSLTTSALEGNTNYGVTRRMTTCS